MAKASWPTATLAAAAMLLILGCLTVNCSQIHNVSIGTGGEQGLVIAHLSSGEQGILCYLAEAQVGDAVCAVMHGRPKATKAVASIFTGVTARNVVAALNGCPDFKPDQSGGWNLNNDCNVVTGPTIPAGCQSRRLSVDCGPQVTLRHGVTPNEGLVLVGLNGTLGTVCATGVGATEAAAVCRSLGFSSPERGFPLIGVYRPNTTVPEENSTSVESLRCAPGAPLTSCTWRPVTSPDCFRANNRLSVSCPEGPATPRPVPSPSLVCHRQRANICFPTALLTAPSDVEVTQASGLPTLCTVDRQNNGSHLCLGVHNYSNCAEVSSRQPQYTEYLLVARFKGELDASGNYVRPPLKFDLYCVLSGETLATGASIAPEFATPTTARDGHEGGEVVLELYKDLSNGNFSDPVVGSVEVGTVLYAAVVIKNANAMSWLSVINCWAIDGPWNVTLVNRKCPAARDVALIPVNNTAMAVRFQAFLHNASSGRLNLVCSTIVCRIGDPSDDCSRVCGDAFEGSDRPERRVTRPVQLTVHSRDGGGGSSAGRVSAGGCLLALLAISGLAGPLPMVT